MYKRVGVTFAIFTALMLAWNLVTPSNPDHVQNMVMHSTLTVMFLISVSIPRGQWLQISALALGSMMTACASEPSFHAASAVAMTAVILRYAYGGFVSLKLVDLILTASIQIIWVFCVGLVSRYSIDLAIGHSFAWTALTFLGVWLYWATFRHAFPELVKQNRELLEINKKLLKGCDDGVNAGKTGCP